MHSATGMRRTHGIFTGKGEASAEPLPHRARQPVLSLESAILYALSPEPRRPKEFDPALRSPSSSRHKQNSCRLCLYVTQEHIRRLLIFKEARTSVNTKRTQRCEAATRTVLQSNRVRSNDLGCRISTLLFPGSPFTIVIGWPCRSVNRDRPAIASFERLSCRRRSLFARVAAGSKRQVQSPVGSGGARHVVAGSRSLLKGTLSHVRSGHGRVVTTAPEAMSRL
jgi:hypothetical protein